MLDCQRPGTSVPNEAISTWALNTGPHAIALTDDDKRLVVTDYFLNEDDFGKIHFEGDHRVHVITRLQESSPVGSDGLIWTSTQLLHRAGASSRDCDEIVGPRMARSWSSGPTCKRFKKCGHTGKPTVPGRRTRSGAVIVSTNNREKTQEIEEMTGMKSSAHPTS